MFFSATPILVNNFAVFATAWANFVIELLTSHLLTAAIGEGQDFVDFVLHFLFLFFLLVMLNYTHRLPKSQVDALVLCHKSFVFRHLRQKVFSVDTLEGENAT